MAAAMGGGGFTVVSPATQGFTKEATAAIVSQIKGQIDASLLISYEQTVRTT